jgi:hypothetical protein
MLRAALSFAVNDDVGGLIAGSTVETHRFVEMESLL